MRFKMARLKQTPVKSSPPQKTDKKAMRGRRKAAKRGSTDLASASSTEKKQRLQSRNEPKGSKSKRKSRVKAGNSDEYLPPELRQAGLLAHQSIAKGKCFGPFRGQFIKTGKKTSDDHFFICKVKGVDKIIYLFYVHNDEQEKCMWLQRLQSAANKKVQNMVAYKSAVGVCYEATCDIKPGEELLVLYDDSYGGKQYPAYVENIPVHFIPHTGEGQLQVVPLDEKDNPLLNTDQQDEAGNENAESNCNEANNTENIDGKNNVNNDAAADDDDDDRHEDGDGGSDVDYVKDDDDDDDTEDDVIEVNDDSDDDDYKQSKRKNTKTKKPTLRRKVVIQVYEVKNVNKEDVNTETLKYLCSYCGTVYPSKEEADKHVTSETCKDQAFTCEDCGCIFESNLIKSVHKCIKNLKCTVCDAVFLSNKQLLLHIRNTAKDENHKPSCAECSCGFESMDQKTEHLHDKHNQEKDTFNCPVCDKIYTNLSYLREHIQTHCVDAFKCPQCHKQFSSKSNLQKHIRKHRPDYTPAKDTRRSGERTKKHECQECEKKFDTPHGLEVHIRSHTGERPFECELCHWKFSQKPHLKRHINTVHRSEGDQMTGPKKLPPAELPKTCELCNKVYANSRVLRVHVQSVHQKERPHKCNYCDTTFTQRGHLWRHKHSFHPDCEEVQKKIQTAGCVCRVEDCKQAFACQTDLLSHMSTAHEANWPYICEKCDATFANSSNLRKHIRRRHAEEEGLERPFTCETCNKEFNSMYKLTQHKRTHSGQKDFKCDLCGQNFVQKSGLRKHIRCRRCPKVEGSPIRQLSKKKYECEECSRVFPGPSDLKSHQRTHTGEKPFECNECHKKFSQTGNLTKHIKYVHQKLQRPKDKPREKKFYCSLCGKAFACPSSLAMHCRTHSGTKPFKCDKCEAAFAQQGNLKKHLKRWHAPDGSPKPKRRRTKKKGPTDPSEPSPASEELEQSDGAMETVDESEAEQSQPQNENNDVDHHNEGNEQPSETNLDERTRAEHTAIASILTSINADQSNFLNPRGFTPLNTPTQGFFISSIPQAPSTLGPSLTRGSIIMAPNVSAQVQIPLSTNNMDPSYSRANPVFVPPFVSPVVSVPQTTSSAGTSDNTSTQANTTILPHVNTILSPQMNPPHFVSHTTVSHVPDVTLYPFSPSSLFQH